jgi:hypothetical protein
VENRKQEEMEILIFACVSTRERGDMDFAMMQKNRIDGSQGRELRINTRGIYPRHKGHERL